jgi:uncharacterized protein YecE (DUF72 family)
VSERVLLGCQGWQHEEWVGTFYADEVESNGMLNAYASEFDTVEVSDTFRGIPPLSLVRAWTDAVPSRFRFAFKVPQQISHERQFSGTAALLERFTQRVALLGEKLGPLLVAMPPGLRPTKTARADFMNFVSSLPGGFRWAVEFRHPDWLSHEVIAALKRRDVALALAEGRWLKKSLVLELADTHTASFAYLRWNQARERPGSSGAGGSLQEEEVSSWPAVVSRLRNRAQSVYGYFSNRYTGHAPDDVRLFRQAMERAGVAPKD